MNNPERPDLTIVPSPDELMDGRGDVISFGHVMDTKSELLRIGSVLDLKASLIRAIRTTPVPEDLSEDDIAVKVMPFATRQDDEST